MGIIARVADKLQDSIKTVSGKLHNGAKIPNVTQYADSKEETMPKTTEIVPTKLTHDTDFCTVPIEKNGSPPIQLPLHQLHQVQSKQKQWHITKLQLKFEMLSSHCH